MLDEELMKALEKELPEGVPYRFISAVAQQGLNELKDLLWRTLHDQASPAAL